MKSNENHQENRAILNFLKNEAKSENLHETFFYV